MAPTGIRRHVRPALTEGDRASERRHEKGDEERINETIPLQEFVERSLASDQEDESAMAVDEEGAAETADNAEEDKGEDLVAVPRVVQRETRLEQEDAEED